MNVYDSGHIAMILESLGYKQTEMMDGADIIIVNTCSVREKALRKAFSFIGRMAGLKRKRPGILLGVAGCAAQQEGERLLDRPDGIDFVLGTGAIDRLPAVIKRLETEKRPVADVFMPEKGELSKKKIAPAFPQKKSAAGFVTVMRGCDNFCSYCIVPYVRGRETSRDPEDIKEEIRGLVRSGAREITLLGQNVNSYGKKDGLVFFPELLGQIDGIEGLERIRFTTSHPKDLSDDLINCFRDLDNLCRHIHLPVQSGSNAVLKRMNRRYTRELYLEKIDKLRKACPDIAITSDMIAGFPGETDADFNDTLSLVKQVEFDGLFAFIYSDRPGTAALNFSGKLSENEKKKRLKKLLETQEKYTLKKNRAAAGSCRRVLVEGFSKKQASKNDGADVQSHIPENMQWTGRTSANKIVNFIAGRDPDDLKPGALKNNIRPGQMVYVRIEKALPHSLWGKAVCDPVTNSLHEKYLRRKEHAD